MFSRHVQKSRNSRHPFRARLVIEPLEPRTLLSAGLDGLFAAPAAALTPSQIHTAYGINPNLTAGSGQTIGIVDAYNDPNIASDLHVFDAQFGLPDPVFTKVNQTGGTSYPKTNSGWALEISLDVEWAHAVAPGANILLVEASSNSFSNLLAAVDYAASHASVVSMSWGGSEFSGETAYDGHFVHSGVTFVASSGDNGAPPEWPAASPNVVAVGGTNLKLNSNNTWNSETGWSGSGGGYSAYESEPGYQTAAQSSGVRTNPDVAYDADPNTGFAVYDTVRYFGQTGWFQVGGTSAGAPQWAGLVALADQSRVSGGKTTLDGISQTLPTLYSLYANSTSYANDFHDITSGNNGYSAGTGYDLVTGIGSPKANVVSDLANTTLSNTTPASAVKHSTGGGTGGGNHPHVAAPVSGSTTADTTPTFVIILSNSPAAAPVLASGTATAAAAPAALPVSLVPTALAPAVSGGSGAALKVGNTLPALADQDESETVPVPDPVFDVECMPDRMDQQQSSGAAVPDQALLPWEEACDTCFAGATWAPADAGFGAALAVERLDGPANDLLAAAAGLVGVAGSYWSAPDEAERQRQRHDWIR